MIEFTLPEIVLLIVNVTVTALWIRARDDANSCKHILWLVIDNKDARDQILKAHERFVREKGGRDAVQ